jgi:hypothetical protein
VTNPPDSPNPVPPADEPRQESPTTPLTGAGRPAWYRRASGGLSRLPGRLSIWVAAAALLAGCVVGSCGFVAGALVSHGFGERDFGDRGVSRHDRGGYDGRDGEGRRGQQKERGEVAPSPTSTTPVSPSPSQSPSSSPSVSPTS